MADSNMMKKNSTNIQKEVDLNRTLTFRLARLQSRLNAQAQYILAKNAPISLSEWRCLITLVSLPIDTQQAISHYTNLDKGQISRGIKKLANSGFVSITNAGHDSRRKIVTVTDEGMAVYQQIAPIMQQRQAIITDEFSTNELEQLHHFLDLLEKNAVKLEGLA